MLNRVGTSVLTCNIPANGALEAGVKVGPDVMVTAPALNEITLKLAKARASVCIRRRFPRCDCQKFNTSRKTPVNHPNVLFIVYFYLCFHGFASLDVNA